MRRTSLHPLLRHSLRRLTVAFALLGATIAGAATDAPRLARFTASHPAGGPASPVTFGAPFPRGLVAEGSEFHLTALDTSGPALPVQSRTLSRWPDGSVRWALVDAQVDLAAGNPGRFVLRPGSSPTPTAAITIADAADGIRIDTGRLQFTVPRGRFAVLDAVRLDGAEVPAGSLTAFMDIDGRHFAAEAPQSVRLVESGPLRARVELSGAYGRDFHYVTRIDAYAGKPYVRVLQSFEHRGDRTYSSVRQIGIDIDWRAGEASTTWRAGLEGAAPLRGEAAAAPAVLLQEDEKVFRVTGQDPQEPSAGWVEMATGNHSMVVAGRFVRQEYPQSFHLESGRLRYNLWAPEALPAALGLGVAKTHEFVIAFFAGDTPEENHLATLVEPVLAHVDPDWIVDSGAMRNSLRPGPAHAPFLDALRTGFASYRESIERETWDDWGSLTCKDSAGERPRQGYYGMLNWGDWNFPWYRDLVNGCETWGNLEADLPQVLALGFAATGDPEMHRLLTAAARHFMDVDRVHSPAAPGDSHGMTHARVARHFSFERGGPDLGYVWTEGLLSWYHLSGDARALDAVRDIAAYLVRHQPAADAALTPRQWGWPLIALVAAWEETGDITLRRAIRAYAQGAMRAWPPTSGRDTGVGTLADGLAYAHSVLPNRSLLAWLETHAAGVASAPPGAADPRYFPAVAWIAARNGDAAYRAQAEDAVARHGFGAWGKPFTLAGRGGFRILSLLQ
jgi:hypothetical protein